MDLVWAYLSRAKLDEAIVQLVRFALIKGFLKNQNNI